MQLKLKDIKHLEDSNKLLLFQIKTKKDEFIIQHIKKKCYLNKLNK